MQDGEEAPEAPETEEEEKKEEGEKVEEAAKGENGSAPADANGNVMQILKREAVPANRIRFWTF